MNRWLVVGALGLMMSGAFLTSCASGNAAPASAGDEQAVPRSLKSSSPSTPSA